MRYWRKVVLWVCAAAALTAAGAWAIPASYLLPSNRVKGWLWRKPPSVYTPRTLYRHLDGAADLYLSYGFRQAKTVEFYRGPEVVTLDVYDMARPIQAFGIFASERPEGAKPLRAGAQGYTVGGLAAFWKGPFYVKLSVVEGKCEALEALAKAASMYLPAPAELPIEFRYLPTAHRVRGSERYVKRDALGHRFLRETISADYNVDGKTAALYISDARAGATARLVYGKLADYYRSRSKDFAPVEGLWEKAFTAVDDSLGRVLVTRQGQFVIIAASREMTRDQLRALVKQVALVKAGGRRGGAPGKNKRR